MFQQQKNAFNFFRKVTSPLLTRQMNYTKEEIDPFIFLTQFKNVKTEL
jgi:hypothetical protein